ncbi:MAG: GHMP kinase [Candidatus Latescibacteria bacterium]|nr:GHMP kinase [Candidatus Latescibacterota bacterium]
MIITQVPLRVSFAGGGTDFEAFYREEPGMVVSSAIDKYVYVIVKERFDERIYINYSKKEIVDSVDEIQHELVREAMRLTGVTQGVEITTLADVPSEGSGLGSSSSLTVGLLHALGVYQGELVTAETLAQTACEIEVVRCGKPIGKQDQYIAAYGNLRRLIFRPDGSVEVTKSPLSEQERRVLGSNLLLFYTNRTRSSETILREQRARVGERREALRAIARCAEETWEALGGGEFDRLGDLLNRGWALKRGLASGISDATIEEMYTTAREAGALGGKLCGAGGGGFLLLYVPREVQNRVRQALQGYRELPFFLERDGSRVIFNVRRYEWK